MYKKSPNQYQKAGQFYPLQLRYILNNQPTKISKEIDWQRDIIFAADNDIPAWMYLLSLVVDGFPCLNENEYLEQLKQCISQKKAMIMKDENTIIGAMVFRGGTGSIDFLGIHPQYSKKDISKAFMQKALGELLKDVPIGTPVCEIARQGFLIFPISFLFCGLNIFASATFTALSNGKISAIISALRTFVFISVALLILPQFFDVLGVWIAVPLAELLTTFVSLAFILNNKNVYHYL